MSAGARVRLGGLAGAALALAGVVVAAAFAVPADAVPPALHARLAVSSPADGEVAAQAPAVVVLTFNRDIAAPASVAVTSPSGKRVVDGEPGVSGAVVTAPISTREHGTFTVGFRAVSVDGHPISGRLTFSVGHRSPPYAGPAGDSPGGLPAWALPVTAGGLALVTGGAWWRRRRRTT